MNCFKIDLANPNTSLTVYLPDFSNEMPHLKKRPAVLILPGGGYYMCSDREAEPVALAFLTKGFAAFVLRYSVGKGAAKFPQPLDDANAAMKIIVERAEEFGVDSGRIAAIGFSAGGHLCAALSTIGDIRPNASILCYPCILESISPILAEPVESLDEKVDEKTPATFLVASREDTCVPIKNSLAYACALEKAGIPFEIHIYEKGNHGFSLADNVVFSNKAAVEYNAHVKGWFELCSTWLGKRFDLD